MTRTQINTDPATYAALAALALRLGYTQTRGPRVGEGSPVKLLEAIARGDLEVQRKEDVRRYMIAAHEAWIVLQMKNPHPAHIQAALDSLHEALTAQDGEQAILHGSDSPNAHNVPNSVPAGDEAQPD